MSFSMRNWSPTHRAPEPFSTPASPQDQSPLFATLPVEIRRHIYRQLWLDCGLTQHVLALTPKSYLQSFPCVLSREELDREPGPPPPAAPPDAGPDDDDEQLQPYDDPGDINTALLDLIGEVATPTPSANDDSPPSNSTPWCVHHACFRRWSGKWDHSFSRMYTACYRRDDNRGRGWWPGLRGSPVLTAFLVCRRVYEEASESVFSGVRFAFASLTALGVFVGQVPRGLVAGVRFVDVCCPIWLTPLWLPL